MIPFAMLKQWKRCTFMFTLCISCIDFFLLNIVAASRSCGFLDKIAFLQRKHLFINEKAHKMF